MGIYDELSKLEQPSPAQEVGLSPQGKEKESAPHPTRKATPPRELSRTPSRASSRKSPRVKPRDLPTRDEIQEFSFRLRDELRVKVQAEVPHRWQKELEAIARDLDVKKLELYRFILGEFLGKVKRKTTA
jgi:hypothetical protein